MASINNNVLKTVGWATQFDPTNRFPLEANKIFDDYSKIVEFATTSSNAYAGSIVAALKDYTNPDTNQLYPKGAYFIASYGEGAEVIKIGQVDKDTFIESVVQDGDKVIITWNTGSGMSPVTLDFAKYVDEYITPEAGNGIQLDGNVYKGQVDTSSESFLSVGDGGFKVTGVQSAIDSAISWQGGSFN